MDIYRHIEDQLQAIIARRIAAGDLPDACAQRSAR